MKRLFFVLLCLVAVTTFAQLPDSVYIKQNYEKMEVQIPMRDGVKLFTSIYLPKDKSKIYPFLMQRTCYSVAPYGVDHFRKNLGPSKFLMKDSYIFVYQDIRGKYKSEGTMQIHEPLLHAVKKGAIDESTDTWDAVDWLVKNIPNNNGKAGIYGISYPGWLALVGAVDPHPALKASSEQACMGDLFLGDDFHHNGAFRLSYGMEYSYEVEYDKTTDSDFPFPQYDLFDWYLKLGPLKNVNEKYFHKKIPT